MPSRWSCSSSMPSPSASASTSRSCRRCRCSRPCTRRSNCAEQAARRLPTREVGMSRHDCQGDHRSAGAVHGRAGLRRSQFVPVVDRHRHRRSHRESDSIERTSMAARLLRPRTRAELKAALRQLPGHHADGYRPTSVNAYRAMLAIEIATGRRSHDRRPQAVSGIQGVGAAVARAGAGALGVASATSVRCIEARERPTDDDDAVLCLSHGRERRRASRRNCTSSFAAVMSRHSRSCNAATCDQATWPTA